MPLTQIQPKMIADAQAWGGTYDGFNIRAAGIAGATNQGAAFSNNLYYDGTDWRYVATGEGSVIFQSSGQMAYYSAPSGSAGTIASITPKFIVDADGSVSVKSAAGLGYGTGAGGTVTQTTSKSTAVTLNKPTGQITMNGALLAANTEVGFTLNNSLLTATDIVLVQINNAGNYQVRATDQAAGSVVIRVRNQTASGLSDSPLINFSILKGASA